MLGRIVNGCGAALFLYSTAVQYNDPDPFRWMTVYGLTTLFCVWAAVYRSVPVMLTLPWGVLTGGVAILTFAFRPTESHLMPGFPYWGVFREEVVRETLGLTLCSLWSLGLAAVEARRSR